MLADQREGLLLQLGQAVISAGFTLARQRLTESPEGVRLMLVVRGPQAQLLALEERLGTHRLVRSFEAIAHEPGQPLNGASYGAPPVTPAPRTQNAEPVARGPAVALDMRRIEAELRLLAQDYPQVFPRLLSLERSFDAESKSTAMRHLGQRIGAWVYKRDFALGAHLAPADALKHVAVPALRPLVQAEAHAANALRIRNSPFVVAGKGTQCNCHFFSGYLEALLKEASGNTAAVAVRETQCRGIGADACVFEIHS